MEKPPLTSATVRQLLDEILEVEFSFINTAPVAEAMGQLSHGEQHFLLEWVRRIAPTNIELAHQFARISLARLPSLDHDLLESWALHAMDTYDRSGLLPAMRVMKNLDGYMELARRRTSGATFEQVARVLLPFLHGLAGRRLKLEQAEEAFTDTETIYLPPVIALLPTVEENFVLYKGMTVVLWAQTRFGTFLVPLSESLELFPDPAKALRLFHMLETLRLQACLARELPGLFRALTRLKKGLGEADVPPGWEAVANRLTAKEVSSSDSLDLIQEVYHLPEPDPFRFQGRLYPAKAEARMAERITREKALFRMALAQTLDEVREARAKREAPPQRFDLRKVPDETQPGGWRLEMELDGQPVSPPEEVRGLMGSILLDLGEIPDEYLVPAGPGEYPPRLFREERPDPDEVWQGTYHEEGAHIYNEWDFRRQHYHKKWCVVREKEVTPVYDDFVKGVLEKHHGQVRHLRKTFEAMREEERILRRQPHGDDVDIDALVEALADAKSGCEMSARLFTRMHRNDRDMAVAFMVDMSGSTRGWINDAERESLVLLGKALDILGDRYAIYGFSGMTRKRCELYRVKAFDEPNDETVQARISGIRPKDYTRMGFAIRHLSFLLNQVEARTRLLITLSDGKPDDYNDYHGEYGIEDTRRALLEARRTGIHPFCITIDEQGPEYLPRMYGPASYAVVDDVRSLPLKVADIYRRLTT